MMKTILHTTLTCLIAAGLYGCSSGLFTAKAPVELKQAWASDITLRTPESVLHDKQRNVLYVSNINSSNKEKKDGDGFISKLSPDGKIENLYWVSGLNDPKGMALHNNVLYVADLDEIVAIAVETGAVLGKYKADKAEVLNDVTVDGEGNVYVSDSGKKRIYHLRNGRVTTWLDNTRRETPNGLLYDKDRLLIAFMSSGNVRRINTENKNFSDWADHIKYADGIASTGNGGYFVSGWEGEVYYLNEEGRKWKVLDTKGKKVNAADISYSEEQKLLYVPTFHDNRVVAYTVSF
ncbi:SMP-30/gluconolactonase/LRE family protein [Pontibacter ruber]|uniref:SMP-30/gluconolactonase/LRE family protein n=1 Tax=Pontibacter ruber TaxID=1343895 RepID=A0ABW5D0I0_9BACT|nr:gluconolaconase [Pontibacter ruber]